MKKKYVIPITECLDFNRVNILAPSVCAGGDGNGIPAEARKPDFGCLSTDDFHDWD